MKVSLVVNEGVHKGKFIPITLSQFLIGRDPQCHLRPASPIVSKRHCLLSLRDGKVFVRDLNSTNGTRVNKKRVKGERELHHDDCLQIGVISFIVRLETGAPVDKPIAVLPGKKPAEGVEDESAAALLLEDGKDVPAGSTVFNVPTSGETTPPPNGSNPPPKKETKGSSTIDAAKALLEKYRRRERT